MIQNNNETAAHQAADAVDNVADDLESAAYTAGVRVLGASRAAREATGRAALAAERTYEEAGQFARNSADNGYARARYRENGFERHVRENLKSSLLLAAALGAVAFAWWRRK
jgi:hypothetical protein